MDGRVCRGGMEEQTETVENDGDTRTLGGKNMY